MGDVLKMLDRANRALETKPPNVGRALDGLKQAIGVLEQTKGGAVVEMARPQIAAPEPDC